MTTLAFVICWVDEISGGAGAHAKTAGIQQKKSWGATWTNGLIYVALCARVSASWALTDSVNKITVLPWKTAKNALLAIEQIPNTARQAYYCCSINSRTGNTGIGASFAISAGHISKEISRAALSQALVVIEIVTSCTGDAAGWGWASCAWGDTGWTLVGGCYGVSTGGTRKHARSAVQVETGIALQDAGGELEVVRRYAGIAIYGSGAIAAMCDLTDVIFEYWL